MFRLTVCSRHTDLTEQTNWEVRPRHRRSHDSRGRFGPDWQATGWAETQWRQPVGRWGMTSCGNSEKTQWNQGGTPSDVAPASCFWSREVTQAARLRYLRLGVFCFSAYFVEDYSIPHSLHVLTARLMQGLQERLIISLQKICILSFSGWKWKLPDDSSEKWNCIYIYESYNQEFKSPHL